MRVELSRLALSKVGDVDRAVRAFRATLEEDARDAEALDGLIHALTESRRWQELTEVLEQRAAGLEGDAARRDWVRAARIFDEELGDPARAIKAWRILRVRLGNDAESADMLAALLAKTSRWVELATLLEHEATAAEASDRGADLWVRVGDLHRARTGSVGEAIAAYDLALSIRGQDLGAQRGLEDLVERLRSSDRGGVAAKEVPKLLGSTTALLGRIYAASDDWAGTIALLEPRLAAASTDAARVEILVETAGLLERRRGTLLRRSTRSSGRSRSRRRRPSPRTPSASPLSPTGPRCSRQRWRKGSTRGPTSRRRWRARCSGTSRPGSATAGSISPPPSARSPACSRSIPSTSRCSRRSRWRSAARRIAR